MKGKKADAEKRRRELLTSLDQGLSIDSSKEALAQYLEKWLKICAGRLAPLTFYNYDGYVHRYLVRYLGHIPIHKLQPMHVQQMEDELLESGLSGTTVRQAHNILHKALKDAVRLGVVTRNVVDSVTPPRKNTREMDVLSPSQLLLMFDALEGTALRTLLILDAHTGLRRGELLGLKWSDIDLQKGSLSLQRALQYVPGIGFMVVEPKSEKGRRTIALGPSSVAELRSHRVSQTEARLSAGLAWQKGNWTFTRPDGRHLTPDVVSHEFEKLMTRLNLPNVRLHDLRHTHATLLLAQGVHPKVVQERLGHASISITMDTYSHVIPGLQEKAALAFETALNEEAESGY